MNARPNGPAVVLDPPPAYLAALPDFVFHDGNGAAESILDGLRRRGIYARPTFAEVEAERARRGLRSGVVISASRPARIVLPMGPWRTARQEPGEVSESARQNRERVEADLGGVSTTQARRAREDSRLDRSTRRVLAALAGGRWQERATLISHGVNAADRSAIHKALVRLVAEGRVEERQANGDAHGEFRLVEVAA
ncbi:hypothetical protein [Nocardioides pakistanensis]